jgi:hypothetical protein
VGLAVGEPLFNWYDKPNIACRGIRAAPEGVFVLAISICKNCGEPLAAEQDGNARERFQQLAAQWKEKSQHLSNTAQMAMLKPYQQIIGMGDRALPLILEELQREPDHWFWALEAITQVDPVPPDLAGKVRRQAEVWIAWGKKQGYVDP